MKFMMVKIKYDNFKRQLIITQNYQALSPPEHLLTLKIIEKITKYREAKKL